MLPISSASPVELVVPASVPRTVCLRAWCRTGPEWIRVFERKHVRVLPPAVEVLQGPTFGNPDIHDFHVRIVPIGMICPTRNNPSMLGLDWLTGAEVRSFARDQGLPAPPPTAACRLREDLTGKALSAMGFYSLVIMHEPIEVSDSMQQLVVGCDGPGDYIGTCHGQSGATFDRRAPTGFVFLEPPSQ